MKILRFSNAPFSRRGKLSCMSFIVSEEECVHVRFGLLRDIFGSLLLFWMHAGTRFTVPTFRVFIRNSVRFVFFFSLLSEKFCHFFSLQFCLVYSTLVYYWSIRSLCLTERVNSRTDSCFACESARVTAPLLFRRLLYHRINEAVFRHFVGHAVVFASVLLVWA